MTVLGNKMIIQGLHEKGGVKISQFARMHGVSRQTIYNSINGGGSRKIRIYIAVTVSTLPSLLWANNCEEKRLVDDLHYLRAIK